MTLTLGPSRRILASRHYKWWAYGAIAIGMFLTVMDQSGVNIALPLIADYFSTDIPTAQWVTLGYILSTSVMLMPMGRLSDMIGRKKVYVGCFLMFVSGASIGGSAQSFPVLVAAKIFQGIAGAGVQANGMAMVADVFSERERGKAIGLYMTVIGTGSVSGPIVGGFLVSGLGWRSVFFASVPVGFLALAAALAILRGGRPAGTKSGRMMSFDWLGASLSSGALVSFLLAITNAHRLGWSAPMIIVGLLLAPVLLGAFLWWERRAAEPILDLGFFGNRVFSLGVSARFLSFLGSSAVFFLMPFYLVQGLGYPASQAGLMMVPGSLGMALLGPISGRIADRVGTKWPSMVGIAMSASAMFIFSQLTVASPPVHVVAGMLLSGSGMGIFISSNSSSILSTLGREKYGIASAFLNLTRTSANVTGIAIATTIVTLAMGSLGYEPSLSAVSGGDGEGVKSAFLVGLNRAFLFSGSYMLLSAVLSWVRGEAPTYGPTTGKSIDRTRAAASSSLGE